MGGNMIDIVIPCPRGDLEQHIRHWDFDEKGVPRETGCPGSIEARLVASGVSDGLSLFLYRLEDRGGHEISFDGEAVFK